MQEIVIKIPDKLYKSICDMDGGICRTTVLTAIAYGTVLPKRHGNLIDYYDAVELINNKADEEDSNFTIGDIEKFGALLREVNPIIEADRRQKNDQHNHIRYRSRTLKRSGGKSRRECCHSD